MTAKRTHEDVRDMRYRDSLPLQIFRRTPIGIAGLGAVGRQVALMLGTMGHPCIWGLDPDVVEEVNIGTQGYSEHDIGLPKGMVIARLLNHIAATPMSWTHFEHHTTRFEEAQGDWVSRLGVVFVCVDSMSARSAIFEKVRGAWGNGKDHLLVDGRVGARTIRVLTVPEEYAGAYEKTLYTDEQAEPERCTDRMTVYNAGLTAGIMVCQMVNWLNREQGRPLAPDVVLETTMMVMTNGMG